MTGHLAQLFSLPAPMQLIASTSDYSAPIVSNFLPVVYLVGGISLGIFIIVFLIRAFQSFTHHK